MADRDFIQEFGILKIRVDKAFEEIIVHEDLLTEEKVLEVLEKLKGTENYIKRIKREIIIQQQDKTHIHDLAFHAGITAEEIMEITKGR